MQRQRITFIWKRFSPKSFVVFMATLTIFWITSSCNHTPDSSQELSKVLGQALNISMIDSIRQGKASISWTDFRSKYRNISVVYLQDACTPCYPKFIEWHKRMKLIETAEDYTVLFVLNASAYANFTRNSYLYEEIEETYYHFIDPLNAFVFCNPQIARSFLDRSLLIDRRNRIKMVGEPFTNEDMTKVFHIITGVDKQHSGESK